MEIIFKRYIVFSVLCLYLCLFAAVSLFAQEKGRVSKGVDESKKAGVPEEAVNRILTLGYENQLNTDEIVDLFDVTRAAQEQGVPLHSIIGKIEEGLAKRINTHKITQVLYQELDRYQFVNRLAVATMETWGQGGMELQSDDLTRMAGTMAMGLSRRDMEIFFSEVPHTSMSCIAVALEFMAGLRQAGFPDERTRDIVHTGLKSDFFSRPAWSLLTMVRVAVKKNIPEEEIMGAAMDVVQGKIKTNKAFQNLGLAQSDLRRGPHFRSPSGTDSDHSGDHTQTSGHGNNQGAGRSGGRGK